MNLILTPNPIPPETHGRNLRSLLPQEDWDLLRTDCYRSANYICEICGGKGPKHPVECHEEWELILETKTQKLVKLMALCPNCHLVKHIGRAERIGKFEKAARHFLKVNNLDNLSGVRILRDLLNEQMKFLGGNFKLDIEFAKIKLCALLDEQDALLTAFPIIER